jgi:hypothetical protein
MGLEQGFSDLMAFHSDPALADKVAARRQDHNEVPFSTR